MRGTTAVALAVLVGAAATNASARPELSKSRYIARADAICASASKQVAKLGRASTLQQAAAKGPRWLAIDRKALTTLRALPAPPGDAAKVKTLLGLADAAINKGLAGAIAAARSGSGAKYVTAAARFVALQRRAHAAASAYGLHACATW